MRAVDQAPWWICNMFMSSQARKTQLATSIDAKCPCCSEQAESLTGPMTQPPDQSLSLQSFGAHNRLSTADDDLGRGERHCPPPTCMEPLLPSSPSRLYRPWTINRRDSREYACVAGSDVEHITHDNQDVNSPTHLTKPLGRSSYRALPACAT